MRTKAGMDYGAGNLGGGMSNYAGFTPSRVSRLWKKDRAADRMPNLCGDERYKLIERSSALGQRNKFAITLLDMAADHIIQDGFQLSTKCASNRQYAVKVEKRFRKWVESANLTGLDWNESQRLLCKGMMQHGDIGLLFSKAKEEGSFQIITAAAIKNPNKAQKSPVCDGVEVDEVGAPQAFHVAVGTPGAGDTKRIPAEFFHLFANRRDVQDWRGIPCFAGFFDIFDNLDGFTDSVVTQARLQTHIVYAIKTAVDGMMGKNGETGNDGYKYEETELAGILNLLKGQDVQMLKSEAVSLDIDKFITAMQKVISPAVGLPVEMLNTGQANYASSQAAAQNAYKAFRRFQRILSQGLSRLFWWWLTKSIDEGRLEEMPDDFEFSWVLPGFLFINRVESAQADLLEMNAGISTHQEVMHRRGKSYESTMEQLAEEVKDRQEWKLPPLPRSTFIQADTAKASPNLDELAKAVAEYQRAA